MCIDRSEVQFSVPLTEASLLLDDARLDLATLSHIGGGLSIAGSVDVPTFSRSLMGPRRRRVPVELSFPGSFEYQVEDSSQTGEIIVRDFVQVAPEWVAVTSEIGGVLSVRMASDCVAVRFPSLPDFGEAVVRHLRKSRGSAG